MTPIRILLADDQDGIRAAFRLILDAQPDMTVIGEASDGARPWSWPATCDPT